MVVVMKSSTSGNITHVMYEKPNDVLEEYAISSCMVDE
jgi:hypothetical protein